MPYNAVRRERCHACGHETFRNNFLLKEGHHARVFVECASCGAFVARYILHAYVDPTFDLSSSLNRLRHYTDDDSARHVVDEIAVHQGRAREQFDDVAARLAKEPQPTESIIELIRSRGIREDG